MSGPDIFPPFLYAFVNFFKKGKKADTHNFE